jgi:antitoxin VapB
VAITLQLRPDIEARLVGQARAKGVPVNTYVEKLIEKDAGETAKSQKTPAEIRERLMQLAAQWHALPTLDHRSPDDIIGYDEFGLPT